MLSFRELASDSLSTWALISAEALDAHTRHSQDMSVTANLHLQHAAIHATSYHNLRARTDKCATIALATTRSDHLLY